MLETPTTTFWTKYKDPHHDDAIIFDDVDDEQSPPNFTRTFLTASESVLDAFRTIFAIIVALLMIFVVFLGKFRSFFLLPPPSGCLWLHV